MSADWFASAVSAKKPPRIWHFAQTGPNGLLVLLLIAGALLTGCGEAGGLFDGPTSCGVDQSAAEPSTCRQSAGLEVCPRVAILGEQANAAVAADDALWVVQSGANTVGRYDLATGAFDACYVDVGNGKNPYDLHVAHGRLYITNLLASSLTVADQTTGEVIDEITSAHLREPAGVTTTDDYIYVTNVDLIGRNRFGPGSVAVLDRRTLEVLGEVATDHVNTQFARTVDTPDGPRVVIVDTGTIELTNEGAFVASPGAVEVWRESGDPLQPEREVYALPIVSDARIGAPGRPLPTPDGTRLYFASATAPALFELDLVSQSWAHGTDDPLVVYEASGDQTHQAAMAADGTLWVTAFNGDALYAVDTQTNETVLGPVGLGTNDRLLEGPLAVAVAGGEVFVTMSLSNALVRVGRER